jgi:hypothetical protein
MWHQLLLCRTYGAPDSFCDFSQAFRPGLTYAAPAALELWVVGSREAGPTALGLIVGESSSSLL